MRNKWLHPVSHVADCPVCGAPKLSHHLCFTCIRRIKKEIFDGKAAH